MRKKLELLFGLLLLFTVSCKLSEPIEGQIAELKPSIPDKEGVSKISMEPGYRDELLHLQNGELWPYKIIVPDLEEGEKVPLVMALHWSGNNNTYKEFMDCLIHPALSNRKFIVFGPSYQGSSWWHPISAARVLNFVRLAKEVLPVDADKVAVTGFSNGGIGSWYFATNYAADFSAAIPMAGSYPVVEELDVPTYIIHGPNDELFNYADSEKLVNDLKNNGADIQLQTATGLGHYEACSYVNYLIDAGSWLEDRVWK